MAIIRDPREDVIKAGTLRGTLGTQFGLLVGAIVTTLDPLLGTNFSHAQKSAIIIATIALIAITHAADVVARAWTTAARCAAKATQRAASTTQGAALPRPLRVRVLDPPGDPYDGQAVELRLIGGDERR